MELVIRKDYIASHGRVEYFTVETEEGEIIAKGLLKFQAEEFVNGHKDQQIRANR